MKQRYRQLIESVRWIHAVGREVLAKVGQAGYVALELNHYLPLVKRMIHQAFQRVIEGVVLRPDEKLYSLFEAHTELIQRGKAGKPIEFGHKILLSQTGEKFIHHYRVMPRRIADKDLLVPAVEAHRSLFGCYPNVLTTDKGFYESTWIQLISATSSENSGERLCCLTTNNHATRSTYETVSPTHRG